MIILVKHVQVLHQLNVLVAQMAIIYQMDLVLLAQVLVQNARDQLRHVSNVRMDYISLIILAVIYPVQPALVH